MLKYILRRLMLAVPTFLIISMLAFLLGQYATDDPVGMRSGATYTGGSKDPDAEAAFYKQQACNFHLSKPSFYFTLTTDCFPDTLYTVFPPWRKRKMVEMARSCGSWAPVAAYENWLAGSIRMLEALPDSTYERTSVNSLLAAVKLATSPVGADTLIDHLSRAVDNAAFRERLAGRTAFLQPLQPKTGWGRPRFYWYGFDNQYSDWLTGRYAHEQYSPWKKIMYPLRVTLFINVMAIVLSLLLGVWAGVFLSGKSKRADQWSKRTLMIIYVVPMLLVGCLLRFLFATKGSAFYIPRIGGVGTSVYNPELQSFASWVVHNWGRLILPVLTLVLHFVALIALQMRTGMLGVMQMDFTRTARAKGLSNHQVKWGHAFKNALFPVITIIGALLPFAVGGSILLEAIFNINGIGHVVFDAFLANDHGVLMSVVMLSAVLTIAGNLLADILYAWIDPRVKLHA